jgi:CRISPR-associated endonuclease/helicase Cas3
MRRPRCDKNARAWSGVASQMPCWSRPIAHRQAGTEVVHDLEDHLRATAMLARKFAEPWGASDAAATSALWHDLGKYAAEFQAMIQGRDPEAHVKDASGRVNHSSAGALWSAKQFGSIGFGRLLAYVIAGHHAGLPDWIGEGAARGLSDRLREMAHLDRALRANPPRELLQANPPSSGIPLGADASLCVHAGLGPV